MAKLEENHPVNGEHNEYFLEYEPIKVTHDHYIVDGHQRYVKGRLLGYNYFLCEEWSTDYSSTQKTKPIIVYDDLKNGRIDDDAYEVGSHLDSDTESKYEKILGKIQQKTLKNK